MLLDQGLPATVARGKLALSLACIAFGLMACASSPKVTHSPSQTFAVPQPAKVVVLRPTVSYEEVKNSDVRPTDPVDDGGVAAWLATLSQKRLQSNGLVATVNDDGNDRKLSDRLVRVNLDPETARGILANTCRENEDAVVLAQHLRVKVDSELYGRSWLDGRVSIALTVYFGPRKTDLSSTSLKAVLRSCASGEVLWQDTVFIRDVPRIKTPEFDGAVMKMFQNLIARSP